MTTAAANVKSPSRTLVEAALPELLPQLADICRGSYRVGIEHDEMLGRFMVYLLGDNAKAELYDPAQAGPGGVAAFVAQLCRNYVRGQIKDTVRDSQPGPIKDRFKQYLRVQATRCSTAPVQAMVQAEAVQRITRLATPCQYAVLECLKVGMSRKETAARLGITLQQVEDRLMKLRRTIAQRAVLAGV